MLRGWPWSHMAARELASEEAEAGCHHRHETMWLHGSPPLWRGEIRVPPRAWSHVAARELASTRRRSLGATMGAESRGSTGGHLDGEVESREVSRARGHVVAREPASTGRRDLGVQHVGVLTRSSCVVCLGIRGTWCPGYGQPPNTYMAFYT